MCGRFNLSQTQEVDRLCKMLGVDSEQLHFSGDIAPGKKISIIYQSQRKVVTSGAVWSLLLDPATMKPHRQYATFNTRSDKLNTPRSVGYTPFRKSRCIIPASAFIEGLGDRKTYHQIHHEDQAIAFGGLYREWVSHDTGEIVRSASIITLPPVPQWEQIHPKSFPLMLPHKDEVFRAWLDPGNQDAASLEGLLVPKISSPQVATPIGKVSKWNPVGDPFVINP